MGFDCTLHVIDEKLITEQFIPMLLSDGEPHGAFANREDAAEMLQTVRMALVEDDPDAANKVCQLALLVCAAEFPYHYERGFAVSLLEEVAADTSGLISLKLPKKNLGLVANLFKSVTDVYPQLKGKFVDRFQGNYTTGCYVPTDKLPAFHTWVKNKVKRCPKPDRRLFRGLLLVLDEAERRGLAYWEATDLPLPIYTMSPPAEQRAPGMEDVQTPCCADDIRNVQDGIITISSPIGMDSTWTCDINIWPPRFEKIHDEYATEIDRSGQRYLSIAMHGKVEYTLPTGRAAECTYFQPRYREHASDEKYQVVELEGIQPPVRANWIAFINDGIVAVPDFVWGNSGERVPYWGPIGENLRPIESLPVAPDSHDVNVPGGERAWMSPDVVHLPGGRDVLLWGDRGYEQIEGKWVMTYDSRSRRTQKPNQHDHGRDTSNPFAYISDGNGAFLLILDWELQRWRRGHAPQPLLSNYQSVMAITSGPYKSVLLTQSYYKTKCLGCLYWEHRDAVIAIETELFEDEDPESIRYLLYSPQSRRLLALCSHRIWSIPIEHVMSQPVRRASTGRKLRNPPDLTAP